MLNHRTTLALLIVLSPLACDGGSDHDRDASFSTTFRGARLVDASGDLIVTVQSFDGVQQNTKNQRFTRVTIARGDDEKGYWCGRKGLVTGTSQTVRLTCGDYAATVSNDDDEAFSFEVVMRDEDGGTTYGVEAIDYVGDGTFFGDDVERLVGQVTNWSWPSFDDIPLDADKRDTLTRDPFTMMTTTLDKLTGLFGTELYSEWDEETFKVRRISIDVDNDSEFGLNAANMGGDVSATMPERLSLLRYPGKLGGGYVNGDELIQRVQDGFATNASVIDAIDAAISPLGGPVDGLAREVALADVPAALEDALKTAAQEIEARTFAGTDYEAEVFGFYAIYTSPSASDPIAYVVWGGGFGEPDYHDGIVIGFDLGGEQVYAAELEG